MIVFDVATKLFDTEKFPQHTIADLNSDIVFIMFGQAGEAYTLKGNKNTNTRNQQMNKMVGWCKKSICYSNNSYNQRKCSQNDF